MRRRPAALRRRAPARERRRERCARRREPAPRALAGRQPAARRRSTTGPAHRRAGTTCSTARRGLGYVDARHQSLDPTPGATVLTWYRPLGPAASTATDGRAKLLERPWTGWRDDLMAELSVPHPDLRSLATRVDITRYGHAMAIPAPGCGQRLDGPAVGARVGARRTAAPSRMRTGRAIRSSRRLSRAGTWLAPPWLEADQAPTSCVDR